MTERAAFIAEQDGRRLIYFIADPSVEHDFTTGRITVSGVFLGGRQWDGAIPSPEVTGSGGPEPMEGT